MRKADTLTISILCVFFVFLFSPFAVSSQELLKPSNTESYFKGKELIKQGKYNKAIQEFKKELKTNPESAGALFYIGLSHMKKKDLRKALEYFEKSKKVDPYNTSTIGNIGYCNLSLGRQHLALEAFRESLAINPNQPEISAMVEKLKDK